MKSSRSLQIAIALVAALMPFVSPATVFFSDTFGSGSTINSGSPADPTSTSTAYQMLSTKSQTPTPAINNPGDLLFGIGSTSSGVMEVQALFATNPIALVLPGDNLQLTIVFTNRSGILSPTPASSQLGIGLFYSGNIAPFNPLPGGTNVSTALNLANYAQKWQGYVGQIVANGNKIMTRPSQVNATDGWNQELVLSGSSTSTYRNQTTVGSATTGTVTLTTGATYTEVLSITMNDVNSLAITNTLYSGAGTGGTVVVSSGGIATNTTFLTGGFNGFGFGYQSKASGSSNTIDVSSVVVSGSVTAITGPPTIDQQPVDVVVPNGGSCYFFVAATGFSMTYQWHRNGTNLLNGGNISGANSSQLVISPAGSGDVCSGANGYYVTVTGAGPFSTNSEIHSLALGTAKNLIYSGSGSWDLNNSPSWLNGSLTPGFTFNFGDAVTFDDNGAGGTVPLSGSYLSASSVTVSGSSIYTFSGTGSFAGPGSLLYNASAQLTINNANTYTGGTTISNATANLRLGNLNGLGTGPITMALAGGKMEIMQASSSSTGMNGNWNVADDFTVVVDAVNTSFGVVLNGNLIGTPNKTLTINHGSNGSGTNATRIRINGTSTIYNANLNLNDSTFVWSPSQGSGSQTYNGMISGAGAFLQKNSVSYLNGANTYSGGTIPAAGAIGLGIDTTGSPGSVSSGPIGTGPLSLVNDSTTTLAGSGMLFAFGGARIIGNQVQYPSASNNLTLVIGGTNHLTFTGPFALNGQDGLGTGTNRTIQVTNTGLTTISGVIGDSGLGVGLVKTGTGALYLDAVNTYTGLTSNNSNTTNTPGLLAGAGTIAGPVFVQTNSSIGGGSGASIGTLTINNALTLNGNGFFRVNRAGLASDQVSVAGVLTNTGTGTITVTNLGATLVAGDQFFLFNKALSNGAAMTITGAGINWTNKLAVDGSIAVLSTVATNPTNITFSVTSNVLTLSWPADHTGWRLQAQTNSLANGLGTNWVDVAGATSVNSTNFIINPANGAVFYRLVYP